MFAFAVQEKSKLDAECKALKQKVDDLTSELSSSRIKESGLEDAHKELQKVVEARRAELAENTKIITSQAQKIATLYGEKLDLDSAAQALEGEASQLRQENTRLKQVGPLCFFRPAGWWLQILHDGGR